MREERGTVLGKNCMEKTVMSLSKEVQSKRFNVVQTEHVQLVTRHKQTRNYNSGVIRGPLNLR